MIAIETSQAVAVIGAGAMGAGIAQVAAVAGHHTLLIDAEPARAAKSGDEIRQRLRRLADKGRMTAEDAAAAADRLEVLDSLSSSPAVSSCGLVVEAIVEDLEVKRTLLSELEALVSPDCILATNTSSLSVTEIGASLRRPGRFVGMHFFNPAPLMRLVEVVRGLATDPATVATARATAASWGKTPTEVRSTPGFVVNRIARPFYAEALRLYEERAADTATIDAVLRDVGGFRMGPFELTDLIGQDVNESVTRTVWRAHGHDPRYTPSLAQRELVEAGWLGRKSGRGFFDYTPGTATPEPTVATPGEPPASVILEAGSRNGDVLEQLVSRSGVEVDHRDGEDMIRLPSGGVMLCTDGVTATAHAHRLGRPVIVLDHALDPTTTPRLAIAASDGAPRVVLDEATGLLHAAGVTASVIDDTPGLVVARTVATLVNDAMDALWRGIASASDIDTAMKLGTNYPCGPLEWGDRWGAGRVLTILDNLASAYGDGRYRACPLLRRRALTGTPLASDRS